MVHIAALNSKIDILRHLVWNGADINAREGKAGFTALHFAIQNNDENLLKFLLTECPKLTVDAVTYGGRTVLELGYPIAIELVEELKQKGVPSPYSSEDEYDSMSSEDELPFNSSNTAYFPNLLTA